MQTFRFTILKILRMTFKKTKRVSYLKEVQITNHKLVHIKMIKLKIKFTLHIMMKKKSNHFIINQFMTNWMTVQNKSHKCLTRMTRKDKKCKDHTHNIILLKFLIKHTEVVKWDKASIHLFTLMMKKNNNQISKMMMLKEYHLNTIKVSIMMMKLNLTDHNRNNLIKLIKMMWMIINPNLTRVNIVNIK